MPRPCLYVPVNKCGCTSVRSALKKHSDALVVVNRSFLDQGEIHPRAVTRAMWEQRFSFTFIRNPFERLVSAWCMFKNKYGTTFEQVLELALRPDLGHELGAGAEEEIKRHTLPLSHPHYGIVDSTGAPTVNFIGRFERLEEDWKAVCHALQFELALPHLNKTRSCFTSV